MRAPQEDLDGIGSTGEEYRRALRSDILQFLSKVGGMSLGMIRYEYSIPISYMSLGSYIWKSADSCLNETASFFSQLVQGLIDGEEEFVKEMKMFTSHQLSYLDSSRQIPINILNQKEIIFRNIKDIVSLHER